MNIRFMNPFLRSICASSAVIFLGCIQPLEIAAQDEQWGWRGEVHFNSDSLSFTTPTTLASIGSPLRDPEVVYPLSDPPLESYPVDIQNLVKVCNYDPLQLFLIVRDNVKFQPYYGFRKGPVMTWLTKSGSDSDQAELLVTLLRAAGYEAYYEYAIVNMPINEALNWFGVSTVTSLRALSASSGYVGFADTSYYVEQTWVVLKISEEERYRLHPAYKKYTSESGIGIASAGGYDRQDFLNAANGLQASYYTQNLNEEAITDFLKNKSINLINAMYANSPNGEVYEVIGGKEININETESLQDCFPENWFILQNTIYYFDNPSNTPADIAEITIVLRYFDLQSQLQEIEVTFPTSDIIGKPITFYVSPDETVQIRIDGNVIFEDDYYIFGGLQGIVFIDQPFYSRYGINPPNYDHLHSINMNPFGGVYTLALNMGGFEQDDIANRRLFKIEEYKNLGYENNDIELIEESLFSLALDWAKQHELGTSLLCKLGDFQMIQHSALIFATQETSFGVDIPVTAVPIPNSVTSINELMDVSNKRRNAALLLSSSMEHGVIEQNYPNLSGVSTVKYIKENNTRGNKTFFLTSDTQSDVYNDSDFQNGWNSNYKITYFPSGLSNNIQFIIPQSQNITIDSLTGNGFFEIRPTSTGAIINPGSYNGGYATEPFTINYEINPTPIDLLPSPDGLVNPASAEPIDMFSGAYFLEKSDLTIDGSGVRGFNLKRGYSSHGVTSTNSVGKGWYHNYQISLKEHADTVSAFGGKTPICAASSIMAAHAILDLMEAPTDPKNWVLASITADWLMEQIRSNAVTLTSGGQNTTYIRLADGTFASPAGNTSTLSQDDISGLYTLHERYDRSVSFDSELRATAITDADGKSLQFTYYTGGAKDGLLNEVEDAYGRTLTFTYHTSGPKQGLLHTVADSTGRTITYGHNDDRLLTSITDPESHTQNIEYNDTSRLWKLYNEKNELMAENLYDQYGRVHTQIVENDSLQTWEYTFAGIRSVEANPYGDRLVYNFDSKGRVVTIKNGEDEQTHFEYDGQNHLTKLVNGRGDIFRFVYDGNHNLRFVYDGRNGESGTNYEVEMQYDTFHRLRYQIDETNNATEFIYNNEHHLTEIIDPELRSFLFEYYESGPHDGLLWKTTDAGNDVVEFTYDNNGYLDAVVRPDTTIIDYTINSRGDLLETEFISSGDSNTYPVSFTYDKRRLLQTSEDINGQGITNVYDPAGNLTDTIDQHGNKTSYAYSPLSRVKSSVYPDRERALFNYDHAGRIASTVSPLQQTSVYDYDQAGRVSMLTNPLAHTTGHSYDASGNLESLTNPENKTYTWTYTDSESVETLETPLERVYAYFYDARNCLEHFDEPSEERTTYTYYDDGMVESITDNEGIITFTYDDKGRLWKTTEGTNVITRTYDSLDRLETFTDSSGNVISYTYNALGQIKTLTYPGSIGSVTYFYDNAGRLDYLEDWEERVTDFQYDTKGRLSVIILPNGTQRIFDYDFAGRLNYIRDEYTSTQDAISQYDLAYDSMGRISQEIAWPEPEPYIFATATMAYDDDDRLTTWNSQSCVSDADGNLTTGPLGGALTTFIYDARNRLTSVGDTTYTYDAENRRIAQTVDSVETTYVYSPHTALSQLLQSTTDETTTRYVYAMGMLLYEDTNTAIRCYHYDYRGSTVAVTDQMGLVSGRINYGAYGEIVDVIGSPSTHFLYNGAYGVMTDSNGLYYMRARYYNPETRRFMNADPIGFNGGLNWYGFVNGNPVSRIDPSGLVLETVWDVANIGLGLYSLQDNVRAGRWGWAILDAAGLAYDGIATAVPFLPAGVSAGLKSYRAGNSVIDSVNAGIDVANISSQTHKTAKSFDAVSTVPWQAALDGSQIHREVAEQVSGSMRYFDITFMTGSNRASGIQPDMIGKGIWGDITTPSQWKYHVNLYTQTMGVGISILYERSKGVVGTTRLVVGAGISLFVIQHATVEGK